MGGLCDLVATGLLLAPFFPGHSADKPWDRFPLGGQATLARFLSASSGYPAPSELQEAPGSAEVLPFGFGYLKSHSA